MKRPLPLTVYETFYDWSITKHDVSLPPAAFLPRTLCCRVSIKTNMADDSSDEDVDVQNGFLEELEIFLPGDSESDNSDSAGNVGLLRKWSDGRYIGLYQSKL